MTTPSADHFTIPLHEHLGLSHDPQVISVAIPPDWPAIFHVRDRHTGTIFPGQRSQQHAGRGFILTHLQPGQSLSLQWHADAGTPAHRPVTAHATTAELILDNGGCALRLPMTDSTAAMPGDYPAGPVRGLRRAAGPWRGRTFFDTRARLVQTHVHLRETGPVRAVAEYQAEFSDGGQYRCTITLDAQQVFARIDEDARLGAGDQLVWDFADDDLPTHACLLDARDDVRRRRLQYHFDERIARLACWTQQSQLHDFHDGFAFGYDDNDDLIGCVTLHGGSWRGNRLNHVEAWTRRWRGTDPATRRQVPWEAKADTLPSPETPPPERQTSTTAPHFGWEAWLGGVQRSWALVITNQHELTAPLQPTAWGLPERRQNLLRRIQVQRGMMALEDVASQTFTWPSARQPLPEVDVPQAWRLWDRLTSDAVLARLRRAVVEFWTAAGPVTVNPVSSRDLAPTIHALASLTFAGRIPAGDLLRARAQAAFLMHLFGSDDYYPGPASMADAAGDLSLEPTIAGMANQNFYTDVITLCGTAAHVLEGHPDCARWQTKFIDMWRRQLRQHVYPRSGVWEESHTYCHHVLSTVLPLLTLRRELGLGDEFANPDLQCLAQGLLRQIGPVNQDYGALRHVLPLGDHGVDCARYADVYHALAAGIAPNNPTLARQLAWAYREMGGRQTLPIAPVAPTWTDEWVEGLGYFLRTRDREGKESLLALRSGGAWGHHHHDEGSLQLYARGRTILTDAAMGGRQSSALKHLARGHSRWTLAEIEPLNYLWRFSRGWICRQGTLGNFTFVTAYDPVYMDKSGLPRPRHLIGHPLPEPVDHFRTLVRLTPTAYLILDSAVTRLEQIVRFHIPGRHNPGDNGMVRAGMDERTSAYLLPLTPKPPKPSCAVHTADAERAEGAPPLLLTTTEFAYRTGVAASSAFLVSAQPADAPPPLLQCESDHLRLTVEGVCYRLSLTDQSLSLGDDVNIHALPLSWPIDSRTGAVRTPELPNQNR